jgi:hypothetical protein
MTTKITTLNQLLEAAKILYARRQEDPVEETPKAERRNAYEQESSAWRALQTALQENLPVSFIDNQGQLKTFGTIASLNSDLMLNYTDEISAQYCLNGQKLTLIAEFIDTELNALLAAVRQSEQAWETFMAKNGAEKSWRPLFVKRYQDQSVLYQALNANLPISFITADQEIKTIGTLGVFDHDFVVRYSTESNARIMNSIYRLSQAVEFFKPGEQPTTILAAAASTSKISASTQKYSEYLISSLVDRNEAVAYLQAVSSDGSPAEIELCLSNCQQAHPELVGLSWQAAIETLLR